MSEYRRVTEILWREILDVLNGVVTETWTGGWQLSMSCTQDWTIHENSMKSAHHVIYWTTTFTYFYACLLGCTSVELVRHQTLTISEMTICSCQTPSKGTGRKPVCLPRPRKSLLLFRWETYFLDQCRPSLKARICTWKGGLGAFGNTSLLRLLCNHNNPYDWSAT